MSYMECMRTIMPNLIGVVLVGSLEMVIPEWLFPRSLRRVKLAVKEYRLYLANAVRREQKRASTELEKVPSLSTLLVRANDLEKDVNLASGTKTGYLSDEELFGNMFAFNFAGQETTARTVSFCIPYLASYPEVQDWARKEVDEVFRGGKELSYEEVYEKLPRVRALMVRGFCIQYPSLANALQYETLRLHAPVAHLPRQSPPQTTLLQVPSMSMTITIPPTSLVSIPAVISGYVSSELNGLDPYIFDPKRFIVTDEKGKDSLLDEAALLKSGYMPFMTGPRICPGKKFSQVEFARVLSSVLFSGEVRPAKVQGYSGSVTAEDQLRSVMRDTVINRGLSISNVDQYAVDFVPR
jgi:cytochrome P450